MIWPATSSSMPLSSSMSPPRSRSRQILFFTSRISGPTDVEQYGFLVIEPRINSSCVAVLLSISLYCGSGFSGHTRLQSCSKMKTSERPSSARPSACADMAATHAATKRRRSASEPSCSVVMTAISLAAHSSHWVVFCMMRPRMHSSACSSAGSGSSSLKRASTVGSSRQLESSSSSVRSVPPCAMSTIDEPSCARMARASASMSAHSLRSVPRATAYSRRVWLAIRARRPSKYSAEERGAAHASGSMSSSMSSAPSRRSSDPSASVERSDAASSRTDCDASHSSSRRSHEAAPSPPAAPPAPSAAPSAPP
mmetsp:Transcript_40817/g.119148  ORF Transcript_40817/g.119148 Transcript_40817/m.119148 type:complete len:311 (-) Transcript_40817:113-1045(-)